MFSAEKNILMYKYLIIYNSVISVCLLRFIVQFLVYDP